MELCSTVYLKTVLHIIQQRGAYLHCWVVLEEHLEERVCRELHPKLQIFYSSVVTESEPLVLVRCAAFAICVLCRIGRFAVIAHIEQLRIVADAEVNIFGIHDIYHRRRILPFKTYIEQTAHVVYVKQPMECTALCQTEAQSPTLCKVSIFRNIVSHLPYAAISSKTQDMLIADGHIKVCRSTDSRAEIQCWQRLLVFTGRIIADEHQHLQLACCIHLRILVAWSLDVKQRETCHTVIQVVLCVYALHIVLQSFVHMEVGQRRKQICYLVFHLLRYRLIQRYDIDDYITRGLVGGGELNGLLQHFLHP